jgi:DNA-binding CsgD family transcriptional regulator
MSLRALGLDADEERVYRLLVRAPGTALAELADAGEAPTVRRALRSLEGKGMVTRAPGRVIRYSPNRPDVAVESLIRQRQDELNRARVTAAELMDDLAAAARAQERSDLVEVVSGQAAAVAVNEQIERVATREIMATAQGPYPSSGDNVVELENMSAGIAYRVLYDASAIETLGEHVLRHVDAGEQARVVETLPCRMTIADRSIGFVVLSQSPDVVQFATLRPSPLLDSLLAMFEALWASAVPLGGVARPGRPVAGEVDLELLQLMVAGLSDQAIARRLGVSVRTVRRRFGAQCKLLSVRTRFQAGAQGARRGWI